MAAQRNDDEIAAALQGLSAGHHDSTAEHAGSVHGEHVELSPVAPPPPVAAPPPRESPPSKRPPGPVARPAAPQAPPPPPPSATTTITPRPPSALTPSSGPRVRPAAPVRPAIPGEPASPGYEQEVFDDGDETVLEGLPATPLDYRGPRPAPPPRPRKPPVFKTLGFRRTVIPVLLTTGFFMVAMFVARWFVDDEAPLARLPAWTGIMLVLTGVILIALAVANMMLVRAELAKKSVRA